MDSYTIFSSRIARGLIRAEFKLKDIRPNKGNKDKTVFEFYKTDEMIKFLKDNYDIKI